MRWWIKRYSKGTCNPKLTCGEFVALVIVLLFLLVKKKIMSVKTAHAFYRDNGPLSCEYICDDQSLRHVLGTFSTDSFHSDGDVCGRKRLGRGRRCSRQNINL